MSGPPDKYLGVSAADSDSAENLANFLSTQYASGYTTLFAVVPDPTTPGNSWIILSGYGS